MVVTVHRGFFVDENWQEPARKSSRRKVQEKRVIQIAGRKNGGL